MDNETLLQAADAATIAGVTPAAVGRAAREGRLKIAATTPHGTRLFRVADVADYVRARKARAEASSKGAVA